MNREIISQYSFQRLVVNHGTDLILEKIFNKSIAEIKNILNSDLAEIYKMIDNVYEILKDEELKILVDKLREQEKIDDINELVAEIKEFQDTKNIVEISSDRFIEMLEYCNIRVPKPCYGALTSVMNNKAMRTNTMSKSILNPMFNALKRLLSYQLEGAEL